MIDAVLTVMALLAGCLTLEAYAAARGPFGYQSKYGFSSDAEDCEPAEARASEYPH